MRRVLLQQTAEIQFSFKASKIARFLETKFFEKKKKTLSAILHTYFSPDSFGQYYKRGHNTRRYTLKEGLVTKSKLPSFPSFSSGTFLSRLQWFNLFKCKDLQA